MSKNVIMPGAAEGAGTVNQEGDITMKQPVYTFRRLNSTDMFLMFKIMSKIGITEFAECFKKDTVKELVASVGGDSKKGVSTVVGIAVALEAANVIMSNLPKCENEIYQMLANVSDLKLERIKKLDFVTFTEMVIDFIKKEEFKDFIRVVSRLFKPGR